LPCTCSIYIKVDELQWNLLNSRASSRELTMQCMRDLGVLNK